MSIRALVRLALCLGCSFGPAVLAAQSPPASPEAASRARPALRVSVVTGRIAIDGSLDEPEWLAADSIPDLVQIEPREGGVPSGRTVVRVLALPDAVVVGIRADDPDPSRITTFARQRDASLTSEDHVRVVLDPYLDGRSGYVFMVNPNGARYDALVANQGEGENANWDAVWEAATARTATGWSLELRIPVKSLLFRAGLDSWGFNVERRVQRFQETSRWASPNRDTKINMTSRAGLLAGLPEFRLGLGLSVRPSGTTEIGRETPTAPTGHDQSASLDVTQRLGANTLASLTVNTDFAETEVDTRRTNLTRFPLVFPEKRTFFLEGSDVFDFGLGTGDDVRAFFSRRIGLLSGRQVPIGAGLKVNGRESATRFGALVVRTRDLDTLPTGNSICVLDTMAGARRVAPAVVTWPAWLSLQSPGHKHSLASAAARGVRAHCHGALDGEVCFRQDVSTPRSRSRFGPLLRRFHLSPSQPKPRHMNGTTRTLCGTALVLMGISACRTGPGRTGATVRDSANVMVIEHGPEQPSGVEHWSLEQMPIWEINKTEGDDEAYFFTRIVQASTLPQGEVLVADMATKDLRIFDSVGRFVRRLGGSGGGPGEFQALTWVGVDPGGSIAAHDGTLRRLTRFSNDGTVQQILSVPSSPGGPFGFVIGQFGDGSVLMRSTVGLPDVNDLAKLSTGIVRDSIELSRMTPDGTSRTPVGRFPGPQNIRAVEPGIIAMDPAPFGLRTVVAIADTVFYVSSQETYEIRAYHREGTLLQVLRSRVPPRPVTADAKEGWRRQWDKRLAAFKGPIPPPIAALAKHHTFPDVFPSHGDLLVDRLGNLWVEDYRPLPGENTVTTWTVFSPDGRFLATAELPTAQITEIGIEHAIGVWRDETDVPSVRVYRLTKQSRTRPTGTK